ncbi:MAG: LemA family protein [Desulfobacteraceae bacterium]|nr:LemA family protein [Desulfobacteraceae bacterium]
MGKQWLHFFGFFSVLVVIILCSVVFGGYSSLHRSEGRIEITKDRFLNACQSKLDLLPQLLDSVQESESKETLAKLKQTSKEAGIVLHHAVSQKPPLDRVLTLKLETSQYALTKELVKLFLKLEQSKNKSDTESLKAIKKQFFSAQNKVYTAKAVYNTEVVYFNRRTNIFPGFLIAKLFGFNKSEYFELSKDSFLQADRVFGGQAK